MTAALGQDSFKTATAKCSLANAHARIALFNGDFKQAVDIARPVLDTSLTWKGLFGHVGSVIPCPSTAALIVGDADVMLGDYGEVLLMDWGLAISLGTRKDKTDLGGTPPEHTDTRTTPGSGLNKEYTAYNHSILREYPLSYHRITTQLVH